MSVKQIVMAAAGASGGEEVDPNFNQTVLLLHGDGNQGANNIYNPGPPKYLAFTDNSENNFPITVNGDAYGDNSSPYMVPEGSWSNYFNGGASDYLSTASTTAFDFGTGDFTVECWAYVTSQPDALSVVFATTGVNQYWGFGTVGGDGMTMYAGTSGTDIYSGSSSIPPLNQWNHLVWQRASGVASMYLNGVRVYNATYTANFGSSATGFTIGRSISYNAYYVNGYISNARVVKGSAVYSGASFTPPTEPLTAVSGTSLLTCQSNRFVDNSSNNFTITRNGDVSVKPFNPFTDEYSATDGSGYFNGASATDYLVVPASQAPNFGTGNFTVEFWLNPNSTTTSWANNSLATIMDADVAAGTGTAWWAIHQSNQTIIFSSNNANILTSSSALTASVWQHVAVVRNGSTLTIYVNGTSAGSTTYATTVGGERKLFIAVQGANRWFKGYISDLRIVKGTAVYTTNFTPPTEPLTAVSGTELLTCQYQGSVRNVGFIDSSPYDHVITRNGNTTQGSFSPYGDLWSNYFDGTGDYLGVASNAAFAPGTGDFSIEAFVYFGALPASGAISPVFQNDAVGVSNNTKFWFGVLNSSGTYQLSLGRHDTANRAYVAWTPSIGTWYHLVATRESGTVKIFIDGVSQSVTSSTVLSGVNFTQNGVSIGVVSTPNYLNGYLSNVRYLVGAVAYTSNFTPPTAPLTAVPNTVLLTCQSNRFKDNSSNNFTITPTAMSR
jgi:hypothetical protein